MPQDRDPLTPEEQARLEARALLAAAPPARLVLADPTPEELVFTGASPGIWCECKGCGGRTGIILPADLPDVVTAMNVIIKAHRHCTERGKEVG